MATLMSRVSSRQAARSGMPESLVIRLRRLQGLSEPGPDERAFSDEDIAAVQSMRLFLDSGLDEEAIVTITRVLGETMSRLTATTTNYAFLTRLLLPAAQAELERYGFGPRPRRAG